MERADRLAMAHPRPRWLHSSVAVNLNKRPSVIAACHNPNCLNDARALMLDRRP